MIIPKNVPAIGNLWNLKNLNGHVYYKEFTEAWNAHKEVN